MGEVSLVEIKDLPDAPKSYEKPLPKRTLTLIEKIAKTAHLRECIDYTDQEECERIARIHEEEGLDILAEQIRIKSKLRIPVVQTIVREPSDRAAAMRNKIIQTIRDCEGDYISPTKIADRVGCTCNYVYRVTRSLKKSGVIVLVKQRFYRMADEQEDFLPCEA